MRRRSSKYIIYRSPRPKWCPVNGELNLQIANIGGLSFITASQVIVNNPSRNVQGGGTNTSSSTSIMTVSHIRLKAVNATILPIGLSYIYFIAYVPEGVTVTNASTNINTLEGSFFYRHPEWLMAWTRIDYSQSGENNEINLNTGKLKRKLNTGDSIVIGVVGINKSNDYSGTPHVTYGTYSFVTKNN